MTEHTRTKPLGSDETAIPGIAAARKTLSSRDLLGGHRDMTIIHRGKAYCLRETRQGKLILTK